MSDSKIKPEIIVFAGPNGSGKSTITKFAKTVGTYINADDIKRVNHCSDLDAAQIAEKMREDALEKESSNPDINVARVFVRETQGGHGVPEDKIRERYNRALKLIPALVKVCDILHIYDNTVEPIRIFKKRKTKYFRWESEYWSNGDVEKLTGINEYED